MTKQIYLDHAAATPLDPAVLVAMMPFLTDRYFNPSAQYQSARAVRADIEAARVRIAYWLGARPAEIIFTAGGTESDNLAICGIMDQFPDGNVVISAVEHDAVRKTAGAYNHRIAAVDSDGRIELGKLVKLIDDDTALISVIYASNEIGTIQPLKEISRSVASIREHRRKSGNKTPLYLHTDACQATPYLDLHTSRLGVDLMTINASKMYGPKQAGALYVKAGVDLSPQIYGGGQERGLRSGTENVAGIIGMAAALDIVQGRRSEESNRLSQLQKLFVELLEEQIPNVIINGSMKQRLANNVHVSFPGHDNERLMMQLDEAGVIVAVGSACSASSQKPSHVLLAIGCSEEAARSSLRLTMGLDTDEVSVRRVVSLLKDMTKQ